MPNNETQVELATHDPQWAAQFRHETSLLTALFGKEIVAFHHVGSTAVPGLVAKPIIDILFEVRDIEAIDRLSPAIRKSGYESLGEYGLPRRRYIRKLIRGEHSVHIHTWQTGDPEIERHLAFRDYLIAHPRRAAAYGRLKKELVQRFDHDKEGYIDGKDSFVAENERRALSWRRAIRAFQMQTDRLRLLPLNRAEMWHYLNRPGQLEAALHVRLSRDVLVDTARQAMRTKLRRTADLSTEDLLWHTYWLVIIEAESFGAGLIGFKGTPQQDGEVEIGYGIDPNMRRRGYTTEAAAALTTWALAQSPCAAVSAATKKDNEASIRILRKLGFHQVKETEDEYHWIIGLSDAERL